MSDWAKVGTELMEVRNHISGTSYGATRKIAKVYKTGNFVVEGSPDQWVPAREYAYAAGERRYSSCTLRPITPELIAERDQVYAVAVAKRWLHAEAERIDKVARSRDDETILSEYRRLYLESETPA